MARRPIEVSLYATPERARKFREGVIEPRETGSAGNVILTGMRELQECRLDILYRTDKLGREDDARRRYNAGMWLRHLYLKTHRTKGVGSYSPTHGGGGEMSDVQAWNFKCYQDTANDLRKVWPLLERLCCEDNAWGGPVKIMLALDILAEKREGWIPDYAQMFYPTKRIERRGDK